MYFLKYFCTKKSFRLSQIFSFLWSLKVGNLAVMLSHGRIARGMGPADLWRRKQTHLFRNWYRNPMKSMTFSMLTDFLRLWSKNRWESAKSVSTKDINYRYTILYSQLALLLLTPVSQKHGGGTKRSNFNVVLKIKYSIKSKNLNGKLLKKPQRCF